MSQITQVGLLHLLPEPYKEMVEFFHITEYVLPTDCQYGSKGDEICVLEAKIDGKLLKKTWLTPLCDNVRGRALWNVKKLCRHRADKKRRENSKKERG